MASAKDSGPCRSGFGAGRARSRQIARKGKSDDGSATLAASACKTR
jgi:hypothetical protein